MLGAGDVSRDAGHQESVLSRINAFLILHDVHMLGPTKKSQDPACGPDPNMHSVSLIGLIKRYEK